MDYFIGIDIGGSSARVALGDRRGEILAIERFPTRDIGNDKMILEIEQAIARLSADHDTRPRSVGIGSPAPLDNQAGKILRTANLPGIQDLAIVRRLEEKLDLPVAVENDANLAGLGEFRFGIGSRKNWRDALFFTLGTGIGGAYIYNRQLVAGYLGNGMEIGHVLVDPVKKARCSCGKYGCLEAYASLSGLHRRLSAEYSDRELPFSLRELLAVKDDGLQARLRGFMREGGYYLGMTTGNFCQMLSPDAVVFTGGLTGAWNQFEDGFRQGLADAAWDFFSGRLEVVVRDTGANSGLLGGLALAIDIIDGPGNSENSRKS